LKSKSGVVLELCRSIDPWSPILSGLKPVVADLRKISPFIVKNVFCNHYVLTRPNIVKTGYREYSAVSRMVFARSASEYAANLMETDLLEGGVNRVEDNVRCPLPLDIGVSLTYLRPHRLSTGSMIPKMNG
jgi:hypothetical protein